MQAILSGTRNIRRKKATNRILIILLIIVHILRLYTNAQSIGYHPQFNIGFNPYHSTIFGYGLGLPFGANNLSPSKNPLLLGSITASAPPFADKHGFISKAHAKAFLSKLATEQMINLSGYPIGTGGFKDKLNVLKHPELALTPYGIGYGYGKHYGSAVIPNNPYKSVYADYYDGLPGSAPAKPTNSIKKDHLLNSDPLVSSGSVITDTIAVPRYKTFGRYIKPIIKTGAFLTSLLLLGKKIIDTPIRLNPNGMILHDIQPYNRYL